MPGNADNLTFLNGVPELLVLRLLARREMYGYEVVRAIAESTGQVLEFGEGCIYPILHTMEKRRWVSSRRLLRDGRERIYYRITDLGRARLEKTALRWAEISAAIRLAMGGDHVADLGQ